MSCLGRILLACWLKRSLFSWRTWCYPPAVASVSRMTPETPPQGTSRGDQPWEENKPKRTKVQLDSTKQGRRAVTAVFPAVNVFLVGNTSHVLTQITSSSLHVLEELQTSNAADLQ